MTPIQYCMFVDISDSVIDHHTDRRFKWEFNQCLFIRNDIQNNSKVSLNVRRGLVVSCRELQIKKFFYVAPVSHVIPFVNQSLYHVYLKQK